MEKDNNHYLVSIIIPALNEENHIAQCLRAIKELDFPENRYEIILVDNGSTDRTIEISSRFPVEILQKRGGTIGALRNYGAKNAKGDIFAFIDADCQIQKKWLVNAVRHFDNLEIAAVGSRLNHLESTWVAKCWSMMNFEKIVSGETRWVPSGNMLVAKKCFNQVDGFDEQLRTSEDYDLCLRLRSKGYKIISDPNISSIHLDPPKTLSEFYKKEKWHGQEMLKIFLRGNQRISRAFIYAIFYLVCTIGIFSGVAISLIFGIHSVLIFSTSTFVLAPFLLAIKTAYQSKSYKYIFPLGLMFMAYGIARSVVLAGKVISSKEQ